MSNYTFIELSDNRRFTVQEMPRSFAVKSRALKLVEVVRMSGASHSDVVGITEDGKLYTSAASRWSRTMRPGEHLYVQWCVALCRLGLITAEDLKVETAEHDKVHAQRDKQENLERLGDLARELGVLIDETSFVEVCNATGLTRSRSMDDFLLPRSVCIDQATT